MNINGRTRVWLLVILSLDLVLHSCRADGDDPAPDGAPGAAVDAAPGAAVDAAPGAAVDGAPGAAVDAAPGAAADAAPGAAVDQNANPIPEMTEQPAAVDPPADSVTEPPAEDQERALTQDEAPKQEEQAPEVTTGEEPMQQEGEVQTSAVPVAQTTQVETTTMLITTTTAVPTTTEPFVETNKIVNYTLEMKGGVVTIKLKNKISRNERKKLIRAIIAQLNKNSTIIAAKHNRTAETVTSSGLTSAAEKSAEGATTVAQVLITAAGEPAQQPKYRRRRAADGTKPEFGEKDVEVMVDDEEFIDTVRIAVPKVTGGYIDSALISEVLENNKEEIEKESGISPGSSSFTADSAPEYVSDIHYGLLITIIVIISVCLFVILFCMFCIRCCPRQPASSEKTPMTMEEARPLKATPIVQSSPFTDDELVKGETPLVSATAGPSLQSAPPEGQASPSKIQKNRTTPRSSMREKQDPSVTKNGGGQHISKPEEDYEYGIVPLDQLNKAERNQPDVENTTF